MMSEKLIEALRRSVEDRNANSSRMNAWLDDLEERMDNNAEGNDNGDPIQQP